MKLILAIFALALSSAAFSQISLKEAYYSTYDWKKTPEKFTINLSDTTEDEEILFEKRSVEYFQKDEESWQLMLKHTITVVKTDAAIEDNNKMYINNGSGDEVVVQKARVIKPDGSIVELKKEDIKEKKDENDQVEYTYFALDGLEKGAIIEYLHYIKRQPNYSGAVMYLQGVSDKRRIEIDIISPDHLDIEVHAVNNMPEFVFDSTSTDVRRKFLYMNDIKAIKNEYQSPYDALLQKCYYKLNKNFDSGKGGFYTYNNAAKAIYDNIFVETSKSSLKKIKTIVKDMESKGGTTLEDKLRYLEYKLKTDYNILEINLSMFGTLDFAFENKFTTEAGMTKMYAQCLKAAGIKFELVLTSDRDEDPFPADYEAYNFLDKYLIYVNDLDMYWAPSMYSRLGFPPAETTWNKGLFVYEKQLNDMLVPISKVKEIKVTPAELSQDNITALVDFTVDPTNPKVEIEREVSGYKSLYPQAFLELFEDDKKQEAKEEVLTYIDKESKLQNVVCKNDNAKLAGKAPLSVKAEFVGFPCLETAGDNTLFKVGMLIGPQAESYNKAERTLPVLTAFTRQYNRELRVILPEGMRAKNLDQLVMEEVTADGSTGFKSSYVQNGNEIVITIKEYYNKVYYPVEEYKKYEDVLNAAADFNKIVLVLEKI